MKKYDITVIGDINVDLILKGEDLVPSFGQEEKLVDDAILTMGGSGGIFACGAGNLGLRLNFIGTVGTDELGAFLMRGLEKKGGRHIPYYCRGVEENRGYPSPVTPPGPGDAHLLGNHCCPGSARNR